MTDREMVWTVVILAAAYYWFAVRGKRGGMRTGATSGASTATGGASKTPTTQRNSNRRTNPHQGAVFSAAPVSSNGATGAMVHNVGGSNRTSKWRSGLTSGPSGSLVANQWPTTKVSAMGGQRRISSRVTQVPSYTTVPLSTQGIGGGGSLLASS